MNYDFCVIGGGIVWLATALKLLEKRPGASLVVLEKENGVGRHQTGHNSGVVHAGIYYAPGSLKARLCVRGARLLAEFCGERDLPFERPGKVIVATERAELPRLADLHARGTANGVSGLRHIGPEELA